MGASLHTDYQINKGTQMVETISRPLMAGHAVPSRMLERVLVQRPKRLVLEANFLHVTYQLIQALARLNNKGPALGYSLY
jgi:hypothetical protein